MEKIHCIVMESESPIKMMEGRVKVLSISKLMSTPLIVFKGTRSCVSIIIHILAIACHAYCHLLEEGGFEIIARELLKLNKGDGLR